jgi:hypothetical protein
MMKKIDNSFLKQLKRGYFVEKEITVEPEDPWFEGPDYWKGYSVYKDGEGNVYIRYWSSLESKFCCPRTGEFKNCDECENRYQGPERNRMCSKSILLMLENGKILEVFPV